MRETLRFYVCCQRKDDTKYLWHQTKINHMDLKKERKSSLDAGWIFTSVMLQYETPSPGTLRQKPEKPHVCAAIVMHQCNTENISSYIHIYYIDIIQMLYIWLKSPNFHSGRSTTAAEAQLVSQLSERRFIWKFRKLSYFKKRALLSSPLHEPPFCGHLFHTVYDGARTDTCGQKHWGRLSKACSQLQEPKALMHQAERRPTWIRWVYARGSDSEGN